MNNGQTNGIPQGSVLMDFIAEMVLGYIDECLSGCLNANTYSSPNSIDFCSTCFNHTDICSFEPLSDDTTGILAKIYYN
jgi:hypothetical protein